MMSRPATIFSRDSTLVRTRGETRWISRRSPSTRMRTQRVLLALDVDVAGALPDRVGEHEVEEPHHRAVRLR
jgi:hypothetical protein